MPPRKKSALSRHSARAIATKRIRNNQSNDQRAKVNELNRIRTSASRMMLSQEERETSNLNDRLRMQSNRAVANRSGDARLQHDMYKQAFNYDPSADYNQHPKMNIVFPVKEDVGKKCRSCHPAVDSDGSRQRGPRLLHNCRGLRGDGQYLLTVLAIDAVEQPLSTHTHCNDNAPQFSQPSYSADISELAIVGATVIQVSRRDSSYSRYTEKILMIIGN
ncbi:hypothetical protein J6590_038166 [Homalodisca vitripennis]|nr:hypothetical protein J6590_038166 [Homalodisca vitripennis]